MARFIERHLVLLAVIISVTLTALTVAAVVHQGRTLQERELEGLQASAERAAAARQADLNAEVRSAFDAARMAFEKGGSEGLNAWISEQREWLLAALDLRESGWLMLPLTPLSMPLPAPASADYALGEEAEFVAGDVAAALLRYERVAESDDPLVRGPALLAMAACRRKLAAPLAAAALFADAAGVLRRRPESARHGYCAELAAIDCLVAAGRPDEAGATLGRLVAAMGAAHPAAYGRAEVGLLLRRAEQLVEQADAALLEHQLPALEQQAAERDALLAPSSDLMSTVSAARAAGDGGPHMFSAQVGGGRRVTAALGTMPDGRRLALIAPVERLRERFWPSGETGVPWRVALPGEPGAEAPLVALGVAFGDAVLAPTTATLEGMQSGARRRLALLATTAAGTAGAWGLVIWMMMRAIGRQRELVRLQQRFVADVSHELKTPLALIRLLAETLRDGRVRDLDRIKGYHETITRESERLTVLLDNILDFSRIESGRKQYEMIRCDVAEVARQAWALFEPQLAADGFERQMSVAPDLPPVRADPAALGQLIVNLLQNAYRYAGERKFVRLAIKREGANIAITVDDQGIGMTRTQLDRLGDSFYRVPDPRVRRTRGTGLGLAIVHHIVGAHGGRMEVTSRPGHGSTFCVRLPILQTETTVV